MESISCPGKNFSVRIIHWVQKTALEAVVGSIGDNGDLAREGFYPVPQTPPLRERGDKPRTISTPTPTTIVRGDLVEYYRRSKYPNSTVPLFHGLNVLNSPCGVAVHYSTGAVPPKPPT